MISEDIKKGLTFVAVGFLFILVNINLSFNNNPVNIMPNFVGWLLFFVAYPRLEKYAEGKDYLKWAALILTIITTVTWVLDITGIVADLEKLNTIIGIAATVYMFLFFGVLENVARAYGREDFAKKLHTLRYCDLILYFAFCLAALLYAATQYGILALLFGAIGIALIVLAVIVAVTLFKLRNAIANGESAT